jgi:SAM-dependent methyltransferase
MADAARKHLDLLAARAAYAAGENVTETLRRQAGLAGNTPAIIEAAYDLQAGSYIAAVAAGRERAGAYAAELAALLSRHVGPATTLLDIGTGELTTLSLVARALPALPARLFAFDISWSRLAAGRRFAAAEMGPAFARLTPFVAEIGAIPLPAKSVSVTTSSHALEPNGAALPGLLAELFRVTREALVLFEPSWEHAGEEGRRRMERLGYIRDLPGAARALGGTVAETVPLRNIANTLNPTVCHVILPPPQGAAGVAGEGFSVPGTDLALVPAEGGHWSAETGLWFPTLRGLPVLRPSAGVLASTLGDAFT